MKQQHHQLQQQITKWHQHLRPFILSCFLFLENFSSLFIHLLVYLFSSCLIFCTVLNSEKKTKKWNAKYDKNKRSSSLFPSLRLFLFGLILFFFSNAVKSRICRHIEDIRYRLFLRLRLCVCLSAFVSFYDYDHYSIHLSFTFNYSIIFFLYLKVYVVHTISKRKQTREKTRSFN